MTSTRAAPEGLTHREIFQRAWPIILANATVPLLSLVDTAVIGNTGSPVDLGAVALGALVFNFISNGLNFLRMSTTGFVAQAAGASDRVEVRAVVARGLCLAAAIGSLLVVLKVPFTALALQLLHGSESVEQTAAQYVGLRLWAAPAALCTHVARGTLIGLGQSHALLWLEGSINGMNLAFDLLFVGVLGWGAQGVALGSAISEWLGLGISLWLVRAQLGPVTGDGADLAWGHIFEMRQFKQLLRTNMDIFVRTMLLLLGFAVFTDYGARFGVDVLAGNHVLLQFISFCAFFLDGYANVAESLVGGALGSGRRLAFDVAVRRSSALAAGNALALALALLWLGPLAVAALTDLPSVREAAVRELPLAAVYVALSVAAFQLDGIFIGATRTRDMRNASIVSCAVFVVAAHTLSSAFGNRGLWLAFLVFVLTRALTLAAYFPGLRRAIPEAEPVYAPSTG